MAYTGQDQTDYEAGNWYLPPIKYQLPYEKLATTEEDQLGSATGAGIPYTNAFTGGGGNNYTGSTQNLITNFGTAITDRQAKINEMNRPMRPERRTANYNQPGRGVFTPAEQPTFKRRISDFLYDKVPGINRPQSYEDIMTKGYQKPTGPGLPTIFNFMNKMGIQNFAGLPQADQAFIKSQTGYTGPTVFGENTSGLSKDIFGMNVESLFGNYAEGVRKDYERLTGAIDKSKQRHLDLYGSLDEENKYGKTWAEMNKMNLTRFNFRKKQIDRQKDIDIELHEQQFPKPDGTTTGEDGPTPSAINIQKKAIGMPEHLTQGGGQSQLHGTDTSGDFAGKGSGNPFNRADGGRIGYNRGRVVNPGGYAGDTDFTTWLQKQDIDIKTLNLDDLTSLQLEWDKVRPKHIKQADGGRVRFFYGGIATAL